MKKDRTPLALKIVRWIFPRMEILFPSLAHRYFIKIFFTPLRYAIPEKEKIILEQAERFEILIEEKKKIQCYRWGKGPLILLVHGWAGRPTQFRKFIEVLTATGYQVVGFDGPAHGRSDGRSTNIAEFEEALKKIYQAVGEPEAIITHSFGGSAVLYAAMHNLPVRRLINIASPTIGEEIINTYLRAINGSQKTGTFFKNYILQTQGKSFDEFTSLHFIKHMEHPPPLLLVHDEDDRDVYIRHAEELIRIYPAAVLYRTKGLGHTRILRDDKVISRCVTFIREIRL